MNRRLPVALKPVPGELLLSWINRHADFYEVTPLTMLRHSLPEATSLRAADLMLNSDQAARLAAMFSTDPRTVRRMSFGKVSKSAHQFIAKEPLQHCLHCRPINIRPTQILRSQLFGWRITCPCCGDSLQNITRSACVSDFCQYAAAIHRRETLLDDDAERGVCTWTSPLGLACLLLMRRIPWPPQSETNLWHFRVLGAIIPELDAMLSRETSFHFSPKNPILPLHIRPALLAGVAIVERAEPEMLRMLQGHTFGENRNRFIKATDHLIFPAFRSGHLRQMQLI